MVCYWNDLLLFATLLKNSKAEQVLAEGELVEGVNLTEFNITPTMLCHQQSLLLLLLLLSFLAEVEIEGVNLTLNSTSHHSFVISNYCWDQYIISLSLLLLLLLLAGGEIVRVNLTLNSTCYALLSAIIVETNTLNFWTCVYFAVKIVMEVGGYTNMVTHTNGLNAETWIWKGRTKLREGVLY